VKEEEHVPPTLPPDQHAAFVDQDVAAFVEVLAKPLFNYRMARGQLSRPGYLPVECSRAPKSVAHLRMNTLGRNILRQRRRWNSTGRHFTRT
jgi:hypothetical protein